MTEETKREILRDYENKNITVGEIATKYSIARSRVAKIAVEMGAQPRREKAFGKSHRNKVKVCPKCKKRIEVRGARYCCYCGEDIRSNIDILIEKNEKLIQETMLLPQSVRDSFRDVLLANIEELKKVHTTK